MSMTPRIPVFHSDLDDFTSNTLSYTLDFYFKEKFYISDKRDEEIFVYSDDSAKSRELLARYQEQHPNRLVIFLSKNIMGKSINENTISVRSPISVKKIKDALLLAESKINPSRMETLSTRSVSSTEVTPNKHNVVSSLGKTSIEKGIAGANTPKFRATREDIDINDTKAVSKLAYSANDYLQGKLKDLYTKTDVTSLNTPYGQITYFPDEHKISTALTPSTIQTFSSIPCNRKGDFINGDAGTSQGNNRNKTSANSLLWESAVYASRGRLPKFTNIDYTFTIKNWPNMTRLLIIPHSMELLSLWAVNPINLRETLDVSNISQRYVFSLYSALHALNLIEFEAINNESTIRAEEKQLEEA